MASAPAALDHTGTQAAIYPSEAQLWWQGPPITDPTDQGIADPTGGAPGPMLAPELEEDWLWEVVNGETSNGAYGERWVNVRQYGPTGFGEWNDNMSVWETGHSQIVVSNPGSEQGWGVGPARRWAHYPHEDSPNPYRNEGQHLRNGELPWSVASSALYYRTQLAWEQQFAPVKARSPVNPIVPVAPSVPYGQTVPTYSGGAVLYEGLDIPEHAGGIY